MTKMTVAHRRPKGVVTTMILAVAALLSGCATGPRPSPDGPGYVVIGHEVDGDRTLLLRPVSSGRLSSPFGTRLDPFTGKSRSHDGIDYAAAQGTPVYAAGDGLVVNLGPRGSYGNYVRIRHDDHFESAYAHLDRFADTLVAGGRVRQGDLIGYVGSTGRSTGAHLHYEILADGRQVDPFAVEPPVDQTIKGSAIAAVEAAKSGLDSLQATLIEASGDLFGLLSPADGVGGAE